MAPRDDYAQALEYLRMLAQRDFAAWWSDYSRGAITDDQIKAMFAGVVAEYGEQASWEAVNYLVLQRSLDEELAGLPFPDRADPAGFEQAVSSFEWAVNTSREAGVFDDRLARRKLDGVLVRLVSQPAHETVLGNVARDGTAFARVPEPGACSFCLMLASRGAAYQSRAHALSVGAGGVRKGTKRAKGAGFHDSCRCVAIEVRRDGSDLPRINKDLEQLWAESGSTSQADFKLALNTVGEFGKPGTGRNTQVYKLPTQAHRAAIERWQGMDRFYAKVQKVAEGRGDDPEAEQIAAALDDAARQTPLKRDVLMWRGVRNWHAEFGVESFDELLDADGFPMARFKSLSSDRSQSENDFTTFGKAGALLRVNTKKGTPGIWMPSNGDSEMISQQEFLVPPGATMKATRVEKGEVPVIHVELSYE